MCIVEQCDNALHAFVDDTLEKLYSIPNGVNTVTTYIISVESCQSLTTVVKMFGKRVENFEKNYSLYKSSHILTPFGKVDGSDRISYKKVRW